MEAPMKTKKVGTLKKAKGLRKVSTLIIRH